MDTTQKVSYRRDLFQILSFYSHKLHKTVHLPNFKHSLVWFLPCSAGYAEGLCSPLGCTPAPPTRPWRGRRPGAPRGRSQAEGPSADAAISARVRGPPGPRAPSGGAGGRSTAASPQLLRAGPAPAGTAASDAFRASYN